MGPNNAAGYYTAPFDDCNIIVVDAIGEWDTVSIWDNMKKVKSWKYPLLTRTSVLCNHATYRIKT